MVISKHCRRWLEKLCPKFAQSFVAKVIYFTFRAAPTAGEVSAALFENSLETRGHAGGFLCLVVVAAQNGVHKLD